MKKKLLIILLSLVCVFACALGLTACDFSNQSENKSDSEDTEPDLGENEPDEIRYTLNDNGESYSISATIDFNETTFTIPAEYNGKPVTRINEKAFYNCSSLTSVIIPDSIEIIGDFAFRDCFKLKNVTIGIGVISIGEYAFFNCSSLANVIIGNGVKSIEQYAFYYCPSLTRITIPDSVESIGMSAFLECTNLKNVTIGNGIKSIGKAVFEGCVDLTFNEFDNAHYLGNSTNPHLALIKAKDANIDSCTIHEDTKVISDCAFYLRRKLTSITIPDSVTNIGISAFQNCSSLTSVTVGNGVKSIGDKAFSGCNSLTNVTFNGTISQWNQLEKGFNWNENTAEYTIHCTDGDIAKEN